MVEWNGRYVVEEYPIPGRLMAEELLARGLPPGPLYRELKRGVSVTLPNGETLHAAEVCPSYRLIKLNSLVSCKP